MSNDINNHIWKFTHTHDRTGRIIKLDRSGIIAGQQHPNEYFWEIDNNVLIFKSLDKKISNVFDFSSFDGSRLEGHFVLWENSGIETCLTVADDIRVLDQVSVYQIADKNCIIVDSKNVESRKVLYSNTIHEDTNYEASRIDLAYLRNVEVINMYGSVKKDDYIVKESMSHFPFRYDKQISKISEDQIAIRKSRVAVKVGRAIHAFHGVSGNYYHWMILFICKIGYCAHNVEDMDRCVVLLPDYLNEVQKRSAEIVSQYYNLPIIRLCDDLAVEVEELLFPHEPDSIGIRTHPEIMQTFDLIKKSISAVNAAASDLIYISRTDTNFRILENESRVEEILGSFGFKIIHLSGTSLDEQVSILSGAKVVVSPHGAGLTNILFCEPGTKVLEFQSPGHINWCMKNLACLAKLEYGCLMGESTEDDRYVILEGDLIDALRCFEISGNGISNYNDKN